jgi:cytochrome c oxidase assembly factor CtaG
MHEHNPTLGNILLAWELHIEVIVGLIAVGVIYTRGWAHTQHRADRRRQEAWRLVLFLGGLIVLGLAIVSPIQTLTSRLFSAHMVQHLMFTVLAPILLLSADPIPTLLAGLPVGLRRWLETRFLRETGLARALYRLTSPGVAWILFIVTLIGWHDPGVYDAAQRNVLLHPVEHLSFLGTALLFWWHVSGASPHARRLPRGARLAYLLVTSVPVIGAGLFIAGTADPLYPFYADAPRLWDISVSQDQQLGGMIMAITGSLMFLLGGLVFVAQTLQTDQVRSSQTEQEWNGDAPVQAPG